MKSLQKVSKGTVPDVPEERFFRNVCRFLKRFLEQFLDFEKVSGVLLEVVLVVNTEEAKLVLKYVPKDLEKCSQGY